MISAGFYLAYLFLLPIVVYFIWRPKISFRKLSLAIIAALIIDSPITISEFKFNFQMLRAFSHFLRGKVGSYSSVSDFLLRYINRVNSVISHTVIPINQILIFVLIVLGLTILFKYKSKITRQSPHSLLLLWFFSSFPIFIFASGAINSEFSFVGTAVCLIFLTAYFKGEPFSICTLTNPLFVNTTWSYLYENYGQRKYGYLPYFAGPNQSGYLSYLPPDTVKPTLRYLIYEPTIGIPKPAIEIFNDLEELISDKVEEKNFGTFKVEKRKLLTSAEMAAKKATFPAGLTKQLESDSYLPYRCFH